MWVMAIRAHYFAYLNWVCRSFVAICTLFFMAGIANLGLSLFNSNFIYRVMYYVAIVTSHIVYLML